MRAVDGEHQAIQETPALGGRPAEQSIHRGRHPHHAHVIGEGSSGGNRLAVDPALAGNRRFLRDGPLDAAAECRKAKRAFKIRSDRPRSVAFGKRDLVERRAPQPASRRKKRDRFDQIGLAGAVRPHQHDHLRIDAEACGAIAAETRQREPASLSRISGK